MFALASSINMLEGKNSAENKKFSYQLTPGALTVQLTDSRGETHPYGAQKRNIVEITRLTLIKILPIFPVPL